MQLPAAFSTSRAPCSTTAIAFAWAIDLTVGHGADAIPRLSDLGTRFSGWAELRTCHSGIPLLPRLFQPFQTIATPLTCVE